MPTKYYELVMSGRQLVLLAATLIGLIVVAFALGVGVGLEQPRSAPVEVAAVAVLPTPGDATPALVPAPSPIMATPTPAPPEAPTPAPPEGPAPSVVAEPPRTPPPPTQVPTPRGARPATAPEHWVQVAALSRPELAEGVRQRVVALGFRPEQVIVRPGGGSYRVRLGPFPDGSSAARVVSRLRAQGFADAFAVSE